MCVEMGSGDGRAAHGDKDSGNVSLGMDIRMVVLCMQSIKLCFDNIHRFAKFFLNPLASQ